MTRSVLKESISSLDFCVHSAEKWDFQVVAILVGLYELRDMGRGVGFRLYFTWIDEVLVLLLAAGDKNSQERDIETARRRMLDL